MGTIFGALRTEPFSFSTCGAAGCGAGYMTIVPVLDDEPEAELVGPLLLDEIVVEVVTPTGGAPPEPTNPPPLPPAPLPFCPPEIAPSIVGPQADAVATRAGTATALT